MSLQTFLQIYRDQNNSNIPIAESADLINVLNNVWTNKLGYIETKGYCLTSGIINRTSEDLKLCNNINCIFCRELNSKVKQVFNIDE